MKYLKFTFLALIMFSTVSPTFAGDTKLGGIRVGWQRSQLIYTGDLDGVKTGDYPLNTFYIGYYRNKKIAPTINLTSGLEYFQLGYNENADNNLTMHTLSIPIALKLKLGPVFALGGAGFNLVLSDKSSSVGGVAPNPNRFDIPLFLGAGFNFLIFSLEARYHWGMIDAIDDVSGFKNRYLQLGLGVEF